MEDTVTRERHLRASASQNLPRVERPLTIAAEPTMNVVAVIDETLKELATMARAHRATAAHAERTASKLSAVRGCFVDAIASTEREQVA